MGSSHTSDLKIDTPGTTLSGVIGTGRPGVSILRLDEMQLLSQCGRSVPEIHLHVAGTVSNQHTTTTHFSFT